MTRENAEYQALERFVTADKRYRRFIYALSLVFFLMVAWGGYNIQQNITHKIDDLVDSSIARGNARAAEQKTIARETERYNTCIFVIPIDQRTPVNQQKCFDAADLPGGLSRSDFTPLNIPDFSDSSSGTVSALVPQASQPSGSSSSVSSSQPTTATPPAQSNTPQGPTTPNCTIDVLFIHIGNCN